jgi:hypothetical protein
MRFASGLASVGADTPTGRLKEPANPGGDTPNARRMCEPDEFEEHRL